MVWATIRLTSIAHNRDHHFFVCFLSQTWIRGLETQGVYVDIIQQLKTKKKPIGAVNL